MFWLVFYFSLAVFVSFLCSLLESVLLSASPAHIETLSRRGASYSARLKKMKYEISRPLSAILAVNTIANTLGAVGVGAQVQNLFGKPMVTLFSVILTLVILIFSEILPKTIGASYWRALLPFSAYVIQALMFVCYPFVRLSLFVNTFFRAPSRHITREDIIGSARMGVNEGAIYRSEGEIVQNILNLKSKKVSEIMTPRTVVTAFEKTMTVGEVLKKHQPLRFARIPVYKENLDNVIGMIHRYKALEARSQGCENITVDEYVKPIHSVPESMSVTAALHQFIKRKEHIFLVVDEYGSFAGLVSMEDVVETILGIEIVDELDSVPDLREQALKQWRQKKHKAGKA